MPGKDPFQQSFHSRWRRLGLLIGLGNLVFITLVVVLLNYDPILGLTFAVLVSIASGLAVTLYALRQR